MTLFVNPIYRLAFLIVCGFLIGFSFEVGIKMITGFLGLAVLSYYLIYHFDTDLTEQLKEEGK